MTDFRLRTTEKNDVLEAINQFHFDPKDFEWSEQETPMVKMSILNHKPTGYYVIFHVKAVELSPGKKLRVEWEDHYNAWHKKMDICRSWLTELRKEVDAPDLWASIGQEKVLATAASSATLDNRPFTSDELQLISIKLEEIKAYVLEGQTFDAQQAESVEREFAYLKEASQRLGRKDWLTILIGGLFTLALDVALDPEKARGLFALAGTALQSLWGMTQGLLN